MKKLMLVVVSAAVIAAACGSDSDPTEDALTSVCDAEAQVLENVAALATLDPAATTGEELSSMVDDLQSSVDDLESARGDLAEQDVDNVSSAFDSLKSELSDLGDTPLSELEAAATATIGAAIEDFQASYVEAYANSSCTDAPEGEESE